MKNKPNEENLESEYAEIIKRYKDRYKELYHLIGRVPVLIDFRKTGQSMKNLRENNADLIKFVCRHSRMFKAVCYIQDFGPNQDKFIKQDCHCRRNFNCKECAPAKDKNEENMSQGRSVAYMGAGQVSLARCHWGEGKQKISNMEARGISIKLEDILVYAYLAKVPLSDIIQLTVGYHFDEHGVIVCDNAPEYMLLEESND